MSIVSCQYAYSGSLLKNPVASEVNNWSTDVDAALPGIFKMVAVNDRVGPVEGSA